MCTVNQTGNKCKGTLKHSSKCLHNLWAHTHWQDKLEPDKMTTVRCRNGAKVLFSQGKYQLQINKLVHLVLQIGPDKINLNR